MATMLIAQNCTRESGSFMGDQLCALKVAYLFVRNQPDVDRVIMSTSPGNDLGFLWARFLADPRGDGGVPPVTVVADAWNPGDWGSRWAAWDRWRAERVIEGRPFDHYRELPLRIHPQRQHLLCGSERGAGRRNIFGWWYYGQEHLPDNCVGDDVYDVEVEHPPLTHERDVYISPHCKTQGNLVFTFEFWRAVVGHLLDAGVSVTVGYDGAAGPLYDDNVLAHPLYRRHWGDARAWMAEVCRHRLVCCGNTGTGWLAAACGVPLLTVEPHNSCMPDHRYRECGLRNLVEVVDGYKVDELGFDMARVSEYFARRAIDVVRRCVVLTTGCYDVLHAGHVRHLERSRALGTRLVVALNSDASVRALKGTIDGVDRPVNPQWQRRAVLEAMRCVDEVRLFDGPDARDLIRELRPDVLTAGHGYAPDTIVGRELVAAYGGRAVVTCAGDARDEPSTTKIVRRVLRGAEVADIIRGAAPYSVNPVDKLKLVAEHLLAVAAVPGDVADLGSYRGGTAMVLRRLAPERHLHLFDTWAGNPYDDPLCHHGRGEWAADLDGCRALVGNGALTHYHQGVFPHTTTEPDLDSPSVEDLGFAFVYADMDTYQATKDAIAFFWPRLAPGGKMMFDDYLWEPCAGVQRAVDEVFGGYSQKVVVTGLYTCIVTRGDK